MGMGFGGMMGYGGMVGYGGTTSGWWPFVGMLFPLIFLLILLGGGYLVFRRMSETQTSQDPAMEELRTAYARGDLTDEEFEARRERDSNGRSRQRVHTTVRRPQACVLDFVH